MSTNSLAGLTKPQYDFLTAGIDPKRVSHRQGQSHMEAWDIRRHLIRVFGFTGFDVERRDLALVKEIESPPGTLTYKNNDGSTRTNQKTAWTVVYRIELRLIVKAWDGTVLAHWDDGATGDGVNMPSIGDAHDFALKTAYSQALKRCAVNLGDQFGLALYNAGRTDAVVLRSLVVPDGVEVVPPPVDTTPVLPEPVAAPAPAEETTAPPAPAASGPDPATVRDWALGKDRTADGLEQACRKLQELHPQVAAAVVVTEHGDQEQLQVLLMRRARELDPDTPAAAPESSGEKPPEQRRRERLHALCAERGYRDRTDRITFMSLVVGRDIASSTQLKWPTEVEQVITALERHQNPAGPVTPEVARQKREQLQGANA